MKGLIVRNFNWWLGQKMFDRDGILTIGYCYPQMYMAERYNAPGSPYWGMKSFLLLALPDDHPFWSAEAAPMPALERLKPMPYANMLVQRRAGRVTAYAAGVNEGHGHGQFPESMQNLPTIPALASAPPAAGRCSIRPRRTVCWPLSSTTTCLCAR